MSDTVKDYINVFIILSFAWIIALGGGYESLSYNGYPILILCMITSFLVHWIIFIPSFLAKTEKFYDILGTIAYLTVIGFSVYFTVYLSQEGLHLRSVFVASLVIIWALRLGIFLLIKYKPTINPVSSKIILIQCYP